MTPRQIAQANGDLRYFTGKPCIHGHLTERRTANRECIRCRQERRAADEEKNPEKYKIKNKRSRVRNRDKLHQRHRQSYIKNPDKWKVKKEQWRADNPEALRAQSVRRKARKKGVEGTFNGTNIEQLYLDQGGLCLCGSTLGKYHVDHMTPLSRGGSNWPENLQLLCSPCNLSKNDKTMNEWRGYGAA